MTRLGYSFVPLPCAVVDNLLPQLKDTELRILLVVLRQTLGQRDGQGKAKTADWLTHGQLCRRTGRASEAVSTAVNALVKASLIEVSDAKEFLLSTATERRRARTRLFYRPGPVIRNQMRISTDKAKITTEDISSFSCSFRKAGTRINEDIPLSEEARTRIERSRKQIQERLQSL